MNEHRQVLLICTVGGSPEPIITSIKELKPARVCFVPSRDSHVRVASTIVPKCELPPGMYRSYVVENPQHLAECIEAMRKLNDEVEDWLGRGDEYEVVVDVTGGTKLMTAALALVAARWPRCTFSYVGGEVRDREGLGIVQTGTERVILVPNPVELLGMAALQDFMLLFDHGDYASARRLAEESKRNVREKHRKQQFAALEQLAKAFEQWDQFDHAAALASLSSIDRNGLRAALGDGRADRILKQCDQLRGYLERLEGTESPPVRDLIIDLIANAKRRKDEHLYDDAVARLYRAIEALGQLAIQDYGFEGSDKIPVERLPEALREKWAARAENGIVKLGLQDLYLLLDSLGAPLGAKFRELGLDGEKSPLVARNNSILAHGFARVSDKAFEQLWTAALALAAVVGITERDLPVFPKMNPS
ncbi:MAG: TIGR02710 family CRISPR-associated CARF protein [Chloroflexota bacterium]|nr:TIGR02710 family CRISPR-associated CARF protein [Dehalococcoidia bacterium]MDW8253847.1 TIGR02710 family CRISPR-associated CARF protein [Chloroflexota bacterium]